MGTSKDEEVQRLMLLGVISGLEEKEREEIYSLKEQFIKTFSTASKPEFAMMALGLLAAQVQADD